MLIPLVDALQASKLAFCYKKPPFKRSTGSSQNTALGFLMTWCYRVCMPIFCVSQATLPTAFTVVPMLAELHVLAYLHS